MFHHSIHLCNLTTCSTTQYIYLTFGFWDFGVLLGCRSTAYTPPLYLLPLIQWLLYHYIDVSFSMMIIIIITSFLSNLYLSLYHICCMCKKICIYILKISHPLKLNFATVFSNFQNSCIVICAILTVHVWYSGNHVILRRHLVWITYFRYLFYDLQGGPSVGPQFSVLSNFYCVRRSKLTKKVGHEFV